MFNTFTKTSLWLSFITFILASAALMLATGGYGFAASPVKVLSLSSEVAAVSAGVASVVGTIRDKPKWLGVVAIVVAYFIVSFSFYLRFGEPV